MIFYYFDSPFLEINSLCQCDKTLYKRLNPYLYQLADRSPPRVDYHRSDFRLRAGGGYPLKWGCQKGVPGTVYKALIYGATIEYTTEGAPKLFG